LTRTLLSALCIENRPSFHCVGSGPRTWVVRLGGKHPHLLSCPARSTDCFFMLKTFKVARQWWRMPLIPALVPGQPGLQSEFQDSQGYTEKPCLELRLRPPPPRPYLQGSFSLLKYIIHSYFCYNFHLLIYYLFMVPRREPRILYM
jgi:hypothetical protein